MYIIPHLQSEKGNNFDSCSKYAKYISKDTEGKLFNSQGIFVDVEEAINAIDSHSKGGIRRNEAKWYAPVYSLSEEESLHIATSVLDFQRPISNFDDLSEIEQEKYNQKVKVFALNLQTEMAQNFNKQNLGINDKDDILWFGSVENRRKYTGYDEEVKQGQAKQGQQKKGFNTHIHIVQSRKALNEKKSLVSPMANARTKTHQGAGFDRNVFYNKAEQAFDAFFGYQRKENRKFEYFKAQTKTENYWKERGMFKTEHNTKVKYNVNKDKSTDREVIDNSKTIDYFFYLEKRGILSYERKIGNNYYFKKSGQRTGSISVSTKGWKDFSDDTGGGILKAIQLYDKFDWNQSISLIKSFDGNVSDYSDNRKKEIERTIEFVQNLKDIQLQSYIQTRGISLSIAQKLLQQIHYKDKKDNKYYSIGFKNESGGYALRGENFKSQIGSNDITIINKNSNTKNVLLFEGFFNYLSYLQIYGENRDEVVIMNGTSNLKKLITYISQQKQNKNYLYYGDNDKSRAGDRVCKKLELILKEKLIDKRYLYSNYNDLNAYLVSQNQFKSSNSDVLLQEIKNQKRGLL
jgi:hypothetical protein